MEAVERNADIEIETKQINTTPTTRQIAALRVVVETPAQWDTFTEKPASSWFHPVG